MHMACCGILINPPQNSGYTAAATDRRAATTMAGTMCRVFILGGVVIVCLSVIDRSKEQ